MVLVAFICDISEGLCRLTVNFWGNNLNPKQWPEYFACGLRNTFSLLQCVICVLTRYVAWAGHKYPLQRLYHPSSLLLESVGRSDTYLSQACRPGIVTSTPSVAREQRSRWCCKVFSTKNDKLKERFFRSDFKWEEDHVALNMATLFNKA